MRPLPTAVALVIALLAHAPAVSAGQPTPAAPGPQNMPPNRPCRADLERYCTDVQKRGGRMLECLAAHRDQLQAACRARVDGIAQTQAARGPRYTGPVMSSSQLRACRNDVRTLCGDVAPGRGRWLACLQEHEVDLSGECRTELASVPPAGSEAPGPTQAGGAAKPTPAGPEANAARPEPPKPPTAPPSAPPTP